MVSLLPFSPPRSPLLLISLSPVSLRSISRSPTLPFAHRFRDFIEIMCWFFPFSSWLQPQGDHIELHQKRHGKRLDYEERKRKRQAREVHRRSKDARKVLSHLIIRPRFGVVVYVFLTSCYWWWHALCFRSCSVLRARDSPRSGMPRRRRWRRRKCLFCYSIGCIPT